MTQTPTQIATPYPTFEGQVVDRLAVTLKGNAELLKDETHGGVSSKVVEMNDVVHCDATYKVVGIRHYIDTEGNLVREASLKPMTMEVVPFDATDATDDGVIRARARS